MSRLDLDALERAMRTAEREGSDVRDSLLAIVLRIAAPTLIARARLAERMAEATRCHGTKNGKHEWRAGEYDDARENSWCCRCARTAMDILDATHAVLREWDAMEKGDGDAEAKPRSDRMG